MARSTTLGFLRPVVTSLSLPGFAHHERAVVSRGAWTLLYRCRPLSAVVGEEVNRFSQVDSLRSPLRGSLSAVCLASLGS